MGTRRHGYWSLVSMLGAVAAALVGVQIAAPEVSAGPPGNALETAADAGRISTDGTTVCAINSGGSLFCWGSDAFGRIGIGSATPASQPSPVEVVLPSRAGVRQVSVGQRHVCAVDALSDVYCWGSNSSKQLGIGSGASTVNRPTSRVRLPDNLGASSVAVGSRHSCAVLTDTSVACWGLNESGQIGAGSTDSLIGVAQRTAPFPGRVGATSITARGLTTCAVTTNSRLVCWGANIVGLVVPDGPTSFNEPTLSTVPGSGVVIRAVSFSDHHMCIVNAARTALCWGDNQEGEVSNVGIGTFITELRVRKELNVSQIITDGPSCALANGVFCWGPPANPTAVAGVGTPDAIAGGSGGLICLLDDDDFSCRGPDDVGQLGNGAPSAASAAFTPAVSLPNTSPTTPDPSVFAPLGPVRLMDTRAGAEFATIDGLAEGQGPLQPNEVRSLQVAGRGGVPTSAVAVTINVTMPAGDRAGFAVIVPCGASNLTASTLNSQPGTTAANATVAQLDADGRLCVRANIVTHIVIDVTGSIPDTSQASFVTVGPLRMLDTRVGSSATTVDGQFQGLGRRPSGSELRLRISGRAGLPADVPGAFLNVTVTEATGPGFITVHPCGEPRPNASSLNYNSDGTRAGSVVTEVTDGGDVCVYVHASAHVIVDVVATMPSGDDVRANPPSRVLDTRAGVGFTTFDGREQGTGRLQPGETRRVTVGGRAAPPGPDVAVVVTLAAVNPGGRGFLTVFRCGTERPLASTLNTSPTRTTSNIAIVQLDAEDSICISGNVATDVVVDVTAVIVL